MSFWDCQQLFFNFFSSGGAGVLLRQRRPLLQVFKVPCLFWQYYYYMIPLQRQALFYNSTIPTQLQYSTVLKCLSLKKDKDFFKKVLTHGYNVLLCDCKENMSFGGG